MASVLRQAKSKKCCSKLPLPTKANIISLMNRTQGLWLLVTLLALGGCIALGIQLGWFATGIIIVAAVLPDVALIGAFAEEGRLRPERVKFYNTFHSLALAIPVTLVGALTALLTQNFILLLVGLAWFTHIAIDRACGYRLREPDGSIRPIRTKQTVMA